MISFLCDVGPDDQVSFGALGEAVRALAGVGAADILREPNRLLARFPRSSLSLMRRDERSQGAAMDTWRGVYRMRSPGLGTRHILIRAQPVRKEDARVRWRGLLEDVTPVVTQERSRHTGAERLSRGTLAAGDALLDIALLSPALLPSALLPSAPVNQDPANAPPASLTLEAWRKSIHPDDADLAEAGLMRQVESRSAFRVEYRARTSDNGRAASDWTANDWTWVVARGRVAAFVDGRPARVIGLITDIGPWKAAQSAVVESEAKLKALFNMAPVGMVRNAMDGRFIAVNTTFEEMVGYSEEELKRLTYWDLTPTAYAASEASQLESLSNGHRYGPYLKDFIRSDGRRIPVRLNGVLVNPAGEQPSIWSIVENLSAIEPPREAPPESEFFDPVTGLASRHLFHRRLIAACAEAGTGPLSILTIDLDRFTPINSAFGHATGDAVLREMGQRLKRVAGTKDTVGRIGGDEFAIIVMNTAEHEALARLCARIVKDIGQPMIHDGRVIRVGASIGVACFPIDAEDADALSVRCDLALAQAKAAGGATYRFFVPSLSSRAGHLMEIEAALHRALALDELELHYQPKLDLRTGRVSGLEGLIRWRRPDGTLAEPALFIPVAEASKLIHAIGDFAVRRACRDIVALRIMRLLPGRVAVNVSARQFSDETLPERISQILDETGARGSELEVEITESTIMADTTRASDALKRIRALGVSVAVDDFGTGHSSLAYLRRLPITGVKIDRSFLDGLKPNTSEAHIAEAIVRLGRDLSLEVTAEGVETPEQEAFLQSIGCDVGQGYYYSRPLSPSALRIWLAAHMAPSGGA